MVFKSIINRIFDNFGKSTIPLAILFAAIVVATTAASKNSNTDYANGEEIHQASSEKLHQLPFCVDGIQRTISRRHLYVSTLDGKVTALDLANGGNRHWSLETGPGSLISSSIHRLELTNNGQWVRMIPSLSGGLYKFDGETIDPIPITADNLLSSSYKFSDDLVISGGKETRSYGVSARTGQILYECSMNGCINSTNSFSNSKSNSSSSRNQHQKPLKEHDPNIKAGDDKKNNHDNLLDDVVVIRRQTQTVRAIEPRTGNERWNFSVGHHELELLQSAECHSRLRNELEYEVLDIEVSVIVPEGLLIAYNRNEPKNILWKLKFNHPIVNVWRIDENDRVKKIDLFNASQWLWDLDREDIVKLENWISPSIYLGMFEKQLYIQESQSLLKALAGKSRNLQLNLINDESHTLSIPWKPISATSIQSVILLSNEKNGKVISSVEDETETSLTKKLHSKDNSAVTALSVLYASEYVNGNGFYLFSSLDANTSNTGLCDSNVTTTTTLPSEKIDPDGKTFDENFGFEFIDDDAPVKVIIVSLWFWWKEILVISLTSAIVLNLFLTPRIRREREVVVIERHIPVPTAMEAIETDESAMGSGATLAASSSRSSRKNSQRSLSESNSTDSFGGEFRSRFLTDFDLVQCLGKGGFGVVFEAKNKIDDCNYAVKRITLPNKTESRDRVMREVKTLANCEHQNIVRYFQAWIENPPPGWQEEEDRKWMQCDILSTSIDIETPEGTTLPTLPSNVPNGINTSKLKNIIKLNGYDSKTSSWISSLNNNNNNNFLRDEYSSSKGCDKSLRFTDDDSSSFIQFKEDDSGDDDDNVSTNKAATMNINKKLDKNYDPLQVELNDSDSSSSDSSFKIEFKSPSEDSFIRNNSCLKNLTSSAFTTASIQKPLQIKTIPSITTGSVEKPAVIKTALVSNTTRHKRPLSLDLSSKGNVIVSISPSPKNSLAPPQKAHNNQQQQQQNKFYLYIQMQLCKKQSLKDWLRENTSEIRQPYISNIFQQIVDGVNYVHLKGLIHRDLKPSNIFFSLDGQIKIGDFGLVTDTSQPIFENNNNNPTLSSSSTTAAVSSFRYTQQVGTHLYMSPEQLQGRPYDYKVDVYSLGLIFFELLVYFSTEMERIITLKNIRNGKYPNEFDKKHPFEFDLLQSMLSIEPEERPTTFQIIEKLKTINMSELFSTN